MQLSQKCKMFCISYVLKFSPIPRFVPVFVWIMDNNQIVNNGLASFLQLEKHNKIRSSNGEEGEDRPRFDYVKSPCFKPKFSTFP